MKSKKDRPKQLDSLDEREIIRVSSFKEALISPPVLALQRTRDDTHPIKMFVIRKKGVNSYKNRKIEATALFATGLEHLRTRNKNWPQYKGGW